MSWQPEQMWREGSLRRRRVDLSWHSSLAAQNWRAGQNGRTMLAARRPVVGISQRVKKKARRTEDGKRAAGGRIGGEGRLLLALRLIHERDELRHVRDAQVPAFPAEQTDPGQPAELARDGLAVGADAARDVRERRCGRKQHLASPLVLAGKAQQLGVDAALNHQRAELEHAL